MNKFTLNAVKAIFTGGTKKSFGSAESHFTRASQNFFSVTGPVIVLLFLISTISACGGGFSSAGKYKIVATAEMVTQFNAADKLYKRRAYKRSLPQFISFVETHPYNKLTDKARLRIGQIHLKQGNPKEAMPPLQTGASGVYDTEITPTILYTLMLAHHRLGESSAIWALLDRVRWQASRARQRVLIASLGIEAGGKLEKSVDEVAPLYLELLDAYVIETGSIRPRPKWLLGRRKAAAWVKRWTESPTGNLKALHKISERFAGKSSGGYALYKLAITAYTQGQIETAAQAYRKFVDGYPKHDYAAMARIRLTELGRKVDSDHVAVGVVLPLSGRYGPYGKAVLQGIECAAGILDPCRSNLPIRLIVRDSAGDPVQAAQAFQDVLATDYVLGVIGPLARVEVGPVARQAQLHKVPTVTLSQKERTGKEGGYTFRNFMTIEDQVTTLVKHLCNTETREVAVLYPKTVVGEKYRSIFQQQFSDCDGKIQTAQGYSPELGNFQEAIRNLKFSAEKLALGETLPFKALFIPDSYKNLSQILPLLEFLNVRNVQLLGTAGWNNPKLVEKFPEILEGSVFVGGFFADSAANPTRRFTNDFESSYGFEPSFLAAYGYDSMQVIKEVIGRKNRKERDQIRDALSGLRSYPGATGPISFDSSGEAKRDLFLLSIKEGKIQEID